MITDVETELRHMQSKCAEAGAAHEARVLALAAEIVHRSCADRQALEHARELLRDICEQTVNEADEAEKWLRAYGWPAADELTPELKQALVEIGAIIPTTAAEVALVENKFTAALPKAVVNASFDAVLRMLDSEKKRANACGVTDSTSPPAIAAAPLAPESGPLRSRP